MDISEFIEQKGTYLKADVVKQNPNAVFVITEEAVLVENEFKGQKNMRVHVHGEFNQTPFILDLSKTNSRTIAKALGTDTKKWISHKLYLEVYKTKTSDGKLTEAINIAKVE